MLRFFVLLLISLIGLSVSYFYLRKNLRRIAQKNAAEPVAWKRAMNYPLTIIWYAYLFLFFIGITVNNIFF